jgi:hypothetical protein
MLENILDKLYILILLITIFFSIYSVFRMIESVNSMSENNLKKHETSVYRNN